MVFPGKASAADVINDGFWTGIYFKSRLLRSPAQVNILLVHIVIIIKSADGLVHLCFKEHAGAGGPKYLFGFIILAFILFKREQHPSFGERVSKGIDPS